MKKAEPSQPTFKKYNKALYRHRPAQEYCEARSLEWRLLEMGYKSRQTATKWGRGCIIFPLLDEAGDPHWFPCQVAGEYEFGSMNETKPILQKGDKFKIAGHQNELRYIQPTLTAKDHDIPPTVKWVMRKIEDE